VSKADEGFRLNSPVRLADGSDPRAGVIGSLLGFSALDGSSGVLVALTRFGLDPRNLDNHACWRSVNLLRVPFDYLGIVN